MTPRVDAIVAPNDYIGTTRAIYALAARNPHVLAASVPPDTRTSSGIIWSILRALGKRSEHLTGPPQWHEVRRWLTAHRARELVVLRAQHLRERLAQAIAVVGAGTDPEQAFIRRTGAQLALTIARLTAPTSRALPVAPNGLDLPQTLIRRLSAPPVDISPIIEHSSNVRTSADRLDRADASRAGRPPYQPADGGCRAPAAERSVVGVTSRPAQNRCPACPRRARRRRLRRLRRPAGLPRQAA